MVALQRLAIATGLILIGATTFSLPCESPGGLLSNGLDFVPWGTNLSAAELRYLPHLHVTLVLFGIFLTILLTVASGECAGRRQKDIAMLAVPSLALLGIAAYPSSLGLFCGAYLLPEAFVGGADVILALILSFMFYLRNDPV